MKKGDRVYFKELHTATYCNKGGSYQYYFRPGDKYEYLKTWVLNLNDNKLHFITNEMRKKLITQQEFRDSKINEILK